MKAVMLLACVLLLGATVRMQHATFAERAARSELQCRSARPTRGAELASARAPGTRRL